MILPRDSLFFLVFFVFPFLIFFLCVILHGCPRRHADAERRGVLLRLLSEAVRRATVASHVDASFPQ